MGMLLNVERTISGSRYFGIVCIAGRVLARPLDLVRLNAGVDARPPEELALDARPRSCPP